MPRLKGAFISSATAARTAVGRGDISAEDLISHFVARVEERNPTIGAVRFLAADQALEAAQEIDQRRKAGGPLPPLAGVPVVVKENCDTAGVPCSAGLSFRADNRPPADAPVVTRLRDAGAVILGVAVSDPGAFGVRTIEVTHPHDAALTVGGSSGGSAAALSAGFCLAAIGTDTGGSIRIPSACCGTVGLKPSFGALPMEGVYPLIPSLDHVGPMARNVEDVRLIWDALCDGRQSGRPARSIGFDPRWMRDADSVVAEGLAIFLERLKRTGMIVKEVELPDLDEILEMHGRIFFVEGAAHHCANFGDDIPNYPAMAQAWFEMARHMPVADYVHACERRVRFTRAVDHLLEQVDVIATPTLSVLHPRKDAPHLFVSGQPLDFTLAMVRQTCLFNHTGHPALAMPMNTSSAIPPPSLQIVGRHGDEAKILNLAMSIEQSEH